MTPNKNIFLNVLLACAVCTMYQACSSDTTEEEQNSNPGFFTTIYSEQPLQSKLTFNLDSLVLLKNTDEEIDGDFSIKTDIEQTIPVELRSRGVTRKNLCSFPPIRLQLKKAAVADNDWGPYRNYKLVTHCADSLREQELLLSEFLVYKMYAQLTEMSFRAQLLQMEYVLPDTSFQRYAILIENEEEMNNRLGLQELDVEKTKLTSIHFDHYKRFVLFQYMIGNTDWNLGTGHNTKYVLEAGSNSPIVIPYDFDYCGLVNASYARPYPSLPIDNVRQRHFMYRGKKDDDFTAARDEFLAIKDTWYTTVADFPYLSDESKADIQGFMDEFYGIIESEDWKNTVFKGK